MNETLQLADQDRVFPQGQIGIDPGFNRVEVELFQSGRLGLDGGTRLDIIESTPPPESQCRTESGDGLVRVIGPACRREKPLETGRIEFVFVHLQQISRRSGLDTFTHESETSPQVRHVPLHNVAGGLGRFVSPQLIDQPISGDDPIGVQGQERKHFAFPGPSEGNGSAFAFGFERSKDADLHTPTLGSGCSAVGQCLFSEAEHSRGD